jgi:adenine-specific DNA-methyltransferase
MSKKLDQLKNKLREMFQMDQADLDFGIYRIMNAKRDEVERFLDADLLPTVRTALEKFQPTGFSERQKEPEEAIKAAELAGFKPDDSPKVQKLRADLSSAASIDQLEEEVYSHLATFFARYYQGGDFMSLRRYKEGVYALPYEGEEVKLHWANADQYYIKSAENFRTYAFKAGAEGDQRRVRFELTAADTERDNNKATADKERRFILFAAEPLALDGDELVIRFEYRAPTMADWPASVREQKMAEKKPSLPSQKDLSAQAVEALLALPEGTPVTNGIDGWLSWRDALATKQPTEKNPSRTTLERHLIDYTAKNSFDYFIHKNLGAFLRRELDFFIKNEVMFLDDIEEDSAPRVEQYLAKIKALRQIAHKIIDFLAQLEDFQKKLWLKKKLVLETNWLVTLDKVPVELYPAIIANDAQRIEWVRLFAIDEIKGDLGAVGYSEPLTEDFLKANQFLVLDTAFFEQKFKDALLADFDNIDANSNGTLIHGDNFHGLLIAQPSVRGRVKFIYIDPPYNTGVGDFLYKDAYPHSSWASMMADRLAIGRTLQTPDGTIAVSIDDNEMHRLTEVMQQIYGQQEIAKLVWDRNRKNDARLFSVGHEYMIVFANSTECLSKMKVSFREPREGLEEARSVYTRIVKEFGEGWPKVRQEWLRWFESIPVADPKRRLIRFSKVGPRGPYRDDKDISWPGGGGPRYEVLHPITKKPVKIPSRGWVYPTLERFWEKFDEGLISFGSDETTIPTLMTFLFEGDEGQVMPSVFYSYAQTAAQKFDAMFGYRAFDNPKPWEDLARVTRYLTKKDDIVLDFFAGSGSTAHAIFKLLRDGADARKFMLIESGNHFDTVLVPRIQKAAYAQEWADGKPQRRNGISSLIKYIRLESYEDALDNLALTRSADQNALLDRPDAKEFREDYVLRYMLDVESRASLLNLARFEDPFNVTMTITRNDETKQVTVDLVETFNYLLGLRVKTTERVRGILEVTGISPDGERVLVLWRNVHQADNDALDQWFDKRGYRSRDMEFDAIYVNGDNNIPNLRRTDETWKVRLIEEAFHDLMFDVRDV